ncbi:MAG: TIGR00725 family protein [Burkholderiales bacterium]|nr:MAG: TIGR00725 family protein [Burkholderiales bacterium]
MSQLEQAIAAVAQRQRDPAARIRVPVGVIGPRDVGPARYEVARALARGIAQMGLVLVCGGRGGVMEAACLGASEAGGIAVGILPDGEPASANPYAGIVLATGIGEARNAIIARAAFCLVAIGDSFGTLSEVALARQFGRHVIGIEGAARLDGVEHVASVEEALLAVARQALSYACETGVAAR